MDLDKKIVYSYTKQVQNIIKNKYGVHVQLQDLRKIMIPPFKNISYAMLKGDNVKLTKFLDIQLDTIKIGQYLKRKGMKTPR